MPLTPPPPAGTGDEKQQAIDRCGQCGKTEEEHNFRTGLDPEAVAVLAALTGVCLKFTASDAAVLYAKHLAIAGNRAPRRRPGEVAKRLPLHSVCGLRHLEGRCRVHPGEVPDAAGRAAAAAAGAAKVRKALGLPGGDADRAAR